MPRFLKTYCSQCGQYLGPGDSGVGHCADHRVIRTNHNFGWTAVFEGYDGAPDSNDPIGLGKTEEQAIDALFEIESLQNDAA